jgi:hypothetical protein
MSDLIERARAAAVDDGISEPMQPDEFSALVGELADALEAAEARIAELDANAPWLSAAHILCADYGVPPGHISDRLEGLRDKLAKLVAMNKNQEAQITGRHQYIGQDFQFRIKNLERQLAGAQAEMRERCAKVAERFVTGNPYPTIYAAIGKAIRALPIDAALAKEKP